MIFALIVLSGLFIFFVVCAIISAKALKGSIETQNNLNNVDQAKAPTETKATKEDTHYPYTYWEDEQKYYLIMY